MTFQERTDQLSNLSSRRHQRGFTCITMIRIVPGKCLFAMVARVRARSRVSLALPVL